MRWSSNHFAEDLELYVPPLGARFKNRSMYGDSDSEGVTDLDAAVMAWLDDAESSVLLLHGHSGCGKSLYVIAPTNTVETHTALALPSLSVTIVLCPHSTSKVFKFVQPWVV